MPSTTSRVVSRPLASSTVITPSLPTLSIASAMIRPISESLLAEMVPTWAMSLPSTGLESLSSDSTADLTAESMPRFNSIGLAPAGAFLVPPRLMRWGGPGAAVVVPSPATSEVLEATSRTICAPMFSSESWSSISLATVTPSLVIVGEPNFFSMTTLRPLGPRVTLTASASLLTPWRMRCRASSPYEIVFAAIPCFLLFLLDPCQHFLLAEDQMLFVVDLDLGSGVLADENPVPLLDVERELLAFLVDLSLADGDHFGLHRLLLGGVGDDDAPLPDLGGLESLDENTVVKRSNLHSFPPMTCAGSEFLSKNGRRILALLSDEC